MEHARAAPVYRTCSRRARRSARRVHYNLGTSSTTVHRTLTDRSADENGGVGRFDMSTFYANMSSPWPSSAPDYEHRTRIDNGARAQQSPSRPSFKVVRSHSLGEFWKSALHKSMSAKAPGAGEGGQRMDNDGAKQ